MCKTAIALGTFDGLHKGHISVLNAALKSGFPAVCITFNMPPKAYFNKEIKLLMEGKEKAECLNELGFTAVNELDFAAVKDVSPLDFLNKIKEKYNPAVICCGNNYRFGKDAAGDVEYLKKYCQNNNIKLVSVLPVTINGAEISSTQIRALISEGNVSKANSLCCKPFSFCGEIIHGDARGRTIGFPTVNQIFPADLTVPKFGVYKSSVQICGKIYKGITNIGVRPTFAVSNILAETNIFDFNGEVYGEAAKITLIDFIRPEKKFSDVNELIAAIKEDIKK